MSEGMSRAGALDTSLESELLVESFGVSRWRARHEARDGLRGRAKVSRAGALDTNLMCR